MYRTVIFDLDGTLLDTLDDLMNAVNTALTAFGFPVRTREEIRRFIGNGVEFLMARAIPGGRGEPAYPACLAYFKEVYAAHCEDTTKPFDGVVELLTALREAGVQTAIVSNKFDPVVKKLNPLYFGDLIPVAVGEHEADGVRRKPAPDTVFEAMRELGADPETTVYIGDSDVDMETAKNAGIPCISVGWGYRTAEELMAAGATEIVGDAVALGRLLLANSDRRSHS